VACLARSRRRRVASCPSLVWPGVSGAWIGNFTRLAAYQPYLLAERSRASGMAMAGLPIFKAHLRRWRGVARPLPIASSNKV